MKVVETRMQENYFDLMEKLVGKGENAVFHSRSELIRQAIREKLTKEIETIKNNNTMFKKANNDNNLPKTAKQIILHEEKIIQGNLKINLREIGNADL